MDDLGFIDDPDAHVPMWTRCGIWWPVEITQVSGRGVHVLAVSRSHAPLEDLARGHLVEPALIWSRPGGGEHPTVHLYQDKRRLEAGLVFVSVESRWEMYPVRQRDTTGIADWTDPPTIEEQLREASAREVQEYLRRQAERRSHRRR